MRKISVIVPVYNAEAFVSRCIDSVLAQTCSDWELLLVDDGSKDGSLGILNQYAQKDSRIQVFHQENAGAGKARNVGITHATGDYIVFVDSDDFVEKDYFSLIFEKNTDVVFIDAYQRNEQLDVIGVEFLSKYEGKEKDDILRSQMTGKMPWGGWRKAVKNSLIKKHNILYSNHTVGEEAIYSFLALYYAESFSFIKKPVYSYVLRKESLSQTMLDDPWGDVAENLKKIIKNMQIYEKYADTLNAFSLTAAVVSFDRLARAYPYKEFLKRCRFRKKVLNECIDANYGIDSAHLDGKVLLLKPILRFNFYLAIYLVSKLRK